MTKLQAPLYHGNVVHTFVPIVLNQTKKRILMSEMCVWSSRSEDMSGWQAFARASFSLESNLIGNCYIDNGFESDFIEHCRIAALQH